MLSFAVATAVLAFMLSLWYPGPLFEAAGGDRLVFILVAVDVTLGPLITLVIFKAGKKGLKFDLAVIASLQLAALVYGMHTVYVARPGLPGVHQGPVRAGQRSRPRGRMTWKR